MSFRKKKSSPLGPRLFKLRIETLEIRLPLHGESCDVGNCAPDLHLEDVAMLSTRANEEIVFDLFANGAQATDVDEGDNPTGNTLRMQLDPDDGPANASLTPDGVFSWTPTPDQIGIFEFVVIAIDEGSPPLADAEILTVEVRANSAPDLSSVPDVAAFAVNSQLVINLTASDPDDDNLSYSVDPDQAPNGVTIEQTDNNNAILRWTPSAEHAGQDVGISLLVVDDGGPRMSDSEVFVVRVMSVIAADDTYSLAADTVLSVDDGSGVLANDSDSDSDMLTAAIVDQPSNGSVSLNDDGSFAYTPNAGFQGTDTFTYKAQDGSGDSSSATVTINVNSNPVAVADSFVTNEGETLSIAAASGVLSNDSDANGDTLTASLALAPENGSLTLNADGSFEYVPSDNFSGTVEFTYLASDGVASSEATTVTIIVNDVNDPPVAVEDTFSTDEDRQLSVSAANGVLANDSDIDSVDLTAALVDGPNNGTLSLNAAGSFVYTPVTNFNGTDSFTYTVSDGDASSSEVSATINVLAVNDAPMGNSDSYTAVEGTELSIDAVSGVLANDDADVDGDQVTAQLLSGTTNGLLTLNSNGSFTYTANTGFSGTDNFTYSINDGTVGSAAVNVEISVSSSNQPPVGVGDAYQAVEGTTLSVDAAFGVLANDSDADSDNLTAILAGQPSQGTFVLNADGSFEYTPDQDTTGMDGFSYQLSDGVITTGEILVVFSIVPGNSAPVAIADSFDTTMNQLLSVNSSSGVLANDTDADGDALSVTIVDQPSNGSVNLSSGGSFEYQPITDFSGIDTFTYRSNDGTDDSDLTVVTITVAGAQFGAVTNGSFEDASLLGIRTDLVAGALPLNADHVTTAVDYTGYSNPPTYGPHHGFLVGTDGISITPRPTGVYETEQPEEDLIHNLEHGQVWISYNLNLITPEDLSQLEQLVIDGGTNTGVILTPRAANTNAIAVASWARLLTLDRYDSVQIRRFIETNRGKSTEGYIPSGQKLDNAASEVPGDGLPH